MRLSEFCLFIEFEEVHAPVSQAISPEIESSLPNTLIDPHPGGIYSCNIENESMLVMKVNKVFCIIFKGLTSSSLHYKNTVFYIDSAGVTFGLKPSAHCVI